MDNVVVGHLCHDPVLRQPRRTGRPVARFTVAVDVWRRSGDTYVSQNSVFHRVVCFGSTAENVSNSLRKGMEVVAIGEWIDDSYTDELGNRKIQIVLDARTVGPTLRRATAQVVKTERRDDQLTLGTPEPSPPEPSPADPLPKPEPSSLADAVPKAGVLPKADAVPKVGPSPAADPFSEPDPMPMAEPLPTANPLPTAEPVGVGSG